VSVPLTARRVLLALATSAGWERAVRALPGGERGAYRLARGYVAGTRPEDALACAHRLAAALPAGRCIQVGAEQERRADRILAAVSVVVRRGGAVSATIQANLKRSRTD